MVKPTKDSISTGVATEFVRILHLEDSRADAELVKRMMEQEGLVCAITLTPNRSGFEAALAKEAFDLILCDHGLPGYSGFTALRLAREAQPLAPVRRIYTPYTKKGIQYFYARCKPNCPNPRKNFNIGFFEREVTKCLSGLSFTDNELAQFEARTKTNISVFEVKRHKELAENERRKKKLREDLAYLRANKLSLLKTGVYSPGAFLEEENSLNASLASLQDAEHASDASMHEVIKDLLKLSELLKYGAGYYEMADSREKEQFIRIVFSELSVSGNTLTCQCKNGFKALQSRFSPVCDQTEWLSELLPYREEIVSATKEIMMVMNG